MTDHCSRTALYVAGVARRICRCHPQQWWQPATDVAVGRAA